MLSGVASHDATCSLCASNRANRSTTGAAEVDEDAEIGDGDAEAVEEVQPCSARQRVRSRSDVHVCACACVCVKDDDEVNFTDASAKPEADRFVGVCGGVCRCSSAPCCACALRSRVPCSESGVRVLRYSAVAPLESTVDPIAWKTELERVAPRLKVRLCLCPEHTR
jgi:hypothetical protein